MTTTRSALCLLVIMTMLSGAIMVRTGDQGAAYLYLFDLGASFVVFLWYRRDSDARHYLRSRWLSIGVVFAAIFAIPYYLLRSRPSGQRWRAVLRFAGFVVMLVVAAGVGAVMADLLTGNW